MLAINRNGTQYVDTFRRADSDRYFVFYVDYVSFLGFRPAVFVIGKILSTISSLNFLGIAEKVKNNSIVESQILHKT